MANRFPLIVNPDTKEIQEIAQNDNLDLTGNGVYAGGSLGQNGQVLTTNGTTVEWRTLTGGGGGGGGIDSDTTYIVETEEQADGASLNLVAGGSGIGTIRIKFQDSDQLKFDTTDSLTIAPSIKAGSIENSQLENDGFTVRINGADANYALGSTIIIPQYGDVFATATQNISNKTFTDCTMSLSPSTGNSIVSIPNSSLINSTININGTAVALGESITISGGGQVGDNDTTYTLSSVDWSDNGVNNPAKKAVRLTGSDGATSHSVLVAGTGLSVSRNGDEIEFTNTVSDTDTDTTYDISADTLVQGNLNTGARINLNATSNNVKTGATTTGAVDRVSLRNGTGVTVNSVSDSDIQFSIGQAVDTTSNVQFNSLTLTGSLTVEGATTYVDTTNLVVSDKTVTIGDGVTSSLLANGAGILIGTSNINWTYSHNDSAWTATSDVNVVPTKTYKIGGTEVLTASTVLGKSVPLGDIVGTVDTQTLSNKTILSPVMTEIINTGTLYLPAPTIADTLVGRATSDTLTNKTIDGNNNNLSNIGNSSLSNAYMVINGTQRNLGDSFTVTATDAYTDEKAQDTVAAMITSATHSGISFAYDDTAGTLAATVDNISSTTGTIEMRGQSSKLRFHYDQLSDLPSASDWHGMFAHVHATGAAYYAHGGVWVELANAGAGGGSSTLSGLTDTDLTTTSPVAGDVLTYDGTNWIPSTNTTGNFSGTFTGNVDAGVVTSDSFVKNGGTSSQYLMADGSLSNGPTIEMGGTMTATILPDTNAAYDLGSAEYKIRHLFLSDNTLYYEGEYLKVAQHNAGQGAGQASYMIPLSKIKEVLNASTDFATFKAEMLAIADAG